MEICKKVIDHKHGFFGQCMRAAGHDGECQTPHQFQHLPGFLAGRQAGEAIAAEELKRSKHYEKWAQDALFAARSGNCFCYAGGPHGEPQECWICQAKAKIEAMEVEIAELKKQVESR